MRMTICAWPGPFWTHEPRRFWHGEFQLGHLVYWTSSTIKRVVRSILAAEAYSVSEAVEEAQWLRSVLAEIVTLSDSFNLCQAVKPDKGTGSDKRLRIVEHRERHLHLSRQPRCSQML